MTGPTTTTGIRISPQLWAEFGLLCKAKGTTRNGRLVDLIRAEVVSERVKGPPFPDPASVARNAAVKEGGK